MMSATASKKDEEEDDKTARTKKTGNIFKKMLFADMDKKKVDELVGHSKAAYDAEMSLQWAEAFDLHEKAVALWGEFAKSGGLAIFASPEEKLLKWLALCRCELHKRRLAVLRPFAKGGQPVPERVKMHPSLALTLLGLAEWVAPKEMPPAEEVTSENLRLTRQEYATPRSKVDGLPSYSGSLPANVPAIEYVIRRRVDSITDGIEQIVMTLLDSSKENELLILEAWSGGTRSRIKITEAVVYRPADYPVPAMRIVPSPQRHLQFNSMPLTTHIRGLNAPILETPDRLLRDPWGPRRLCYGGRYFVRKPLSPDRRLDRSEAVYEFSTHTPRPDSKTGEIDDDALPMRLMWVDDHGMMSKEIRAFAVPGLDPLFREYLFAAQMMKIACRHHGASPGPMTEEAQNAQAVQGGMRAARVLLSLVLALGLAAG